MAPYIYMLCAATSFLCAVLLLRGYSRSRYRLLFWSGLCFVGLFANNLVLVLDKLILPQLDLSTFRLVSALVAPTLLLVGLIWEKE